MSPTLLPMTLPTTTSTTSDPFAPFGPISLAALNAKAAMLERLDNKYVVRSPALQAIVADLARSFDVLEIDCQRSFTYETCYFDDADLRSYFDHHQGRRQRMKVRVRRYVDAALCFVEVKLKDKRGMTVKKRMPYAPEKFGTLDDAALEHVRRSHEAVYGRPFDRPLAAVLSMRYRRTTLVAREGQPTGFGDNWAIFDDVGVNDSGDYVFSG